jgi:hypothetical protein
MGIKTARQTRTNSGNLRSKGKCSPQSAEGENVVDESVTSLQAEEEISACKPYYEAKSAKLSKRVLGAMSPGERTII